MTIYLPKKVWIQVWSFLDFKKLHKICKSVCKTWFLDIRESGRLSDRLKIRNCEVQDNELKKILSNWKKLKILELSKETKLDLSATHKFLNKVIIPLDPKEFVKSVNTSLNTTTIFEQTVNKIWFDPHNKSGPLSCPYSIIDIKLRIEVRLYNGNNVQNLSSQKLAVFAENLESLQIILMTEEDGIDERVYAPLFQSLASCPKLEKLKLEVTYNPNFSILGVLIAAYLPQLKSIDISDAFHGLDTSTGGATEVEFGRLNWLPVMGKLESLKFSETKLVFDAATDLRISVSKLKRLEFSNVQIEGVETGTYPFVICSEIEVATFFINLKNMFPELETLILGPGSSENGNHFRSTMGNLSSILNSLGNVKNLIISEMQCSIFHGCFDGNRIKIKNVFEEALNIINKKFPIDTTEIEISDHICNFNIIKENGKLAILRRKLEENP